MFTLLTILTLIAPIPVAMLVWGLLRRLLTRWGQLAEVPAFARTADASTAAEIDAARSDGELARQAA